MERWLLGTSVVNLKNSHTKSSRGWRGLHGLSLLNPYNPRHPRLIEFESVFLTQDTRGYCHFADYRLFVPELSVFSSSMLFFRSVIPMDRSRSTSDFVKFTTV